MTKSIFTTVLLALALPVFADQSVYSDKLDNGWQDWSWAKVTKSEMPTDGYQGAKFAFDTFIHHRGTMDVPLECVFSLT